jgi:hypothetical protein
MKHLRSLLKQVQSCIFLYDANKSIGVFDSDLGEVAMDNGSSFWKMDGDGGVGLNR